MKLKTGFYNNRAIFLHANGSTAVIDESMCTAHGNDMMVAQFVFSSGTHTIFQVTWMDMDVNGLVRNKSTTILHGLYSYEPYKWRWNVQNFAVFHLSFEQFDVISVVDKSTDQGKLLSIC